MEAADRRIASVALVAVCALLSACGGASSGAAPHIAPTPVTSSQLATVTVRLDGIPANTTINNRRRAYISPATQSIAISFTPSGGGSTQTFNQNLTPGSSGCTASLVSPQICTVSLALAPGNYIASFTTYDGVLNGSGVPQGNALSQNQNFATTIVAGQNNIINATLQGVPSSILVSPIGGTATQTSAHIFTLDKCFATQQFSVNALDADGNVIVGPGAPAIGLTASNAPFTISGPTTASPNTFTLTRTGLPVGLSSTDATATITPGTGGPPAPVPTTIAIFFNTSNCGVDTLIGSGYNAPEGAAADSNGNVYVADTGNNAIKRVTPGGSVSQFGPSVTQPSAVAVDPYGDVYVTTEAGAVEKITASSITPIATNLVLPTAIASSPNGQTLYVADSGASKIDLYSVSSGFLRTIASGFPELAGVAVDANLNVYAADQVNGLEEILADGPSIEVASGDPNIAQTNSIGVDPAGSVYYTDLALGIVGKIPAGQILVTQFATGLIEPTGLSIAANGDIYVADPNNGSGVIHRYR